MPLIRVYSFVPDNSLRAKPHRGRHLQRSLHSFIPAPKSGKPLFVSVSVGPRALPNNIAQIANELDQELANGQREAEEPINNKIPHALDYASGGCAVPSRGRPQASCPKPLAYARGSTEPRPLRSGIAVARNLASAAHLYCKRHYRVQTLRHGFYSR